MKALHTLLLAGLPLLARAQAGTPVPLATVVNFSVERGQPFGLVLDGRAATGLAVKQVHLDRLAPGQHQVELRLATGRPGLGNQPVRATVWLAEGLETSFVLTQRPGYGWQLRQVSTAALPGYGYEDQEGTYGQPAPDGQSAPDGQVYAPEPGGQPASPGYPSPTAPGYPATPGYPGGPGTPAARATHLRRGTLVAQGARATLAARLIRPRPATRLARATQPPTAAAKWPSW